MNKRLSVEKLFRRYALAMGIKTKFVKAAWEKGDIYKKKQDLVAMRATLYVKEHGKPGMTPEEKQKMLMDFIKTEPDFDKIKWQMPKVRVDPFLD